MESYLFQAFRHDALFDPPTDGNPDVDFGRFRRLSSVSRRIHPNPGSVATAHGKSIVDFDLLERLSDNTGHSYLVGVEAMKYLLMCCMEEKKFDAMSQSECDALMAETVAYCDALRKSGHLIAAEPLEPTRMSMTVRVRSDRVSVTDGPFAETKEQIGGFFLVNARDLNEAVQVASKFPSARIGSIEVRPVKELNRQETNTDRWPDIQQHPR